MPRVTPRQVSLFIFDNFEGAVINSTLQNPQHLMVSSTQLPVVRTLLELIELIPDELLVLEGSSFVSFRLAVNSVEQLIRGWDPRLENQRHLAFDRTIGQPMAVIFQRLKGCPDQLLSEAGSDLSFVSESELRKSMDLDLESIRAAMRHGEWKAATVLGGALVEALLLWAIRRRTRDEITKALDEAIRASAGKMGRPRDNDPLYWDLSQYIEVTELLRIIRADTATQARLAKDFRNLIHPGREHRERARCDRATAFSAVAAAEHVVRDLSETR